MQDPHPFFKKLDTFEKTTGFPRNLRKTITKLRRTALVLLDDEIQTSQNRLAEPSRMLDDADPLLRILASDKSKVRKFAPSYQIKNLIKKLEAKAATIIRDYNQIAPVIRCDYPSDWVASDTFVDTSEVFGRDADKENVIESLLRQDSDSSVTAIVGKRGIGKTTLAKLVYNDKRIADRFDLKMWVCVPPDFDINILMQRAYGFVTEQNPDKLALEDGSEFCLLEALSGKKIFLVLDNVLNINKDNMKYLRKVLEGADESKILVTTHIELAENGIGSVHNHALKGLSYTDSVSLFGKYASGDPANNEHQHLKTIVEICDGIPSAVKILGTLHSRNRQQIEDPHFWREMKERNNIEPMLKLSYDNLEYDLRICLKHCSLFPKGFCFNSHYLIHYWMAEDFLRSRDKNEELEDIGERYLKELFDKIFFQDVVNHGYYFTFKLHDSMHDLLLKEARNYCQRVDLRVMYSKIQAKYLSFYGIQQGDEKFPHVAPSLLAIIIKSSPFKPVSKSFVNRLTSKFKQIRLLCLSGLQFEELPYSVGSLDQLRYLDLSWNLIMMELSEAICKLKSLQTLILLGCSRLKRFPENMRKIIDLRYLEITTKVRRLLGNELEFLHSLRYLHLYHCHHLENLSGKMQSLANLRTLILQGCASLKSLPDDITYLERLETLVIYSCSNLNLKMDLQEEDRRMNLKVFMIYELKETVDLPQFILQGSANTLEYMRIDSCSSLTTLPPWFTNLTSLQKLEIVSCSGLSSLPRGMKRLTALKELKIQKSPTLSESCRRNRLDLNHVQNIHLDPAVASSSR